MSMRFSEVVSLVRRLEAGSEVRNAGEDHEFRDVVSDSRRVKPGALFCCIAGETSDGHDYAAVAEAQGVCALLCERPVDSALPMIVVPSVRAVMGDVAAAVYGHPAERLTMVGVTGTNGKTTTTYVIRSILQAAEVRSGLLGTIIESDGVTDRDADRTTPESCVVQAQLAAMVANGCGACVMETSSHGLFLGRLKGAHFDVPVFTNLNPEHLDFHKDMESYFQAKRFLFVNYTKSGFRGAANAGDPYGRRLLAEFPDALRGFEVAGSGSDLNPDSVLRVTEWNTSLEGTDLIVEGGGLPALRLRSPLVGAFNALCAIAAVRGRRVGDVLIDDDAIVRGVASIPQVPGRLERYVLPNGARCFVDFAHTPAALRSVLSTVRGLTRGRVVSLFGHGGGRYPMNRPELGRAAAELADHVIVTMDNPRDEDPADIARAIVEGIEANGGCGRYEVVLDRGEAIRRGLSLLGPDDVLAVTGKGPEKYLIIGGTRTPFSDSGTVEAWIREEARS